MGYQKIFIIVTVLCFSCVAIAEKLPVNISDKSSSGRTVLISAGKNQGLKNNDPLLIRRDNDKLAAARVLYLYKDKAAVYIVENYADAYPEASSDYNILFGVP